ncbi:MAG: NUMOD3 domain-containing DNA-binding protein [Candidatus Thorarchaeota archaeon]
MKRDIKLYHKIWNKYHPDDPIIKGDGYCIHHIDGDYSNNNINNLCKMTISKHQSFHRKGKNSTEETKQKISKNHANSKGKNNPMYNKNHTEEAKQKISKTRIEKQLSKGEAHPNHKLTQMTVNWIRDILGSEEYREAKKKRLIDQTKLGKLFGVDNTTISGIKRNKIWRK